MSRIKLCGLTRPCDVVAANELAPEYVGFVFARKSRRYVDGHGAACLKARLAPSIKAVGVFVDAPVTEVAALLRSGVIDIAQLHGHEDTAYIEALKARVDAPVIQAFKVRDAADVAAANASAADYVLLDSGAGTGVAFDWSVLSGVARPYFLAGGLGPHNVADAVRTLSPFAVDVSSGIETEGLKDRDKMAAFVAAVREGGVA